MIRHKKTLFFSWHSYLLLWRLGESLPSSYLLFHLEAAGSSRLCLSWVCSGHQMRPCRRQYHGIPKMWPVITPTLGVWTLEADIPSLVNVTNKSSFINSQFWGSGVPSLVFMRLAQPVCVSFSSSVLPNSAPLSRLHTMLTSPQAFSDCSAPRKKTEPHPLRSWST